jgi:hypothetical protein
MSWRPSGATSWPRSRVAVTSRKMSATDWSKRLVEEQPLSRVELERAVWVDVGLEQRRQRSSVFGRQCVGLRRLSQDLLHHQVIGCGSSSSGAGATTASPVGPGTEKLSAGVVGLGRCRQVQALFSTSLWRSLGAPAHRCGSYPPDRLPHDLGQPIAEPVTQGAGAEVWHSGLLCVAVSQLPQRPLSAYGYGG